MAPIASQTHFLADDRSRRAPSPGLESAPYLYVLTVSYNSDNDLKKLVDSLRPLSFVKRLVVVDHSENRGTIDLKAHFPITVIQEPNKGYGAGMNRGLKEIDDEDSLILLCNPDIVLLNPEKIEEIWRYMQAHDSVGLVAPSLVDAKLHPIRSCRKFYSIRSLMLAAMPWIRRLMPETHRNHWYQNNGLIQEVDWCCGAAMFLRGSEADGRPLFDERFFLYFEDVDLCLRMWRESRKVVYYPGVDIQHNESRLSHERLWYFLVHIGSLFKFVVKHRGLHDRPWWVKWESVCDEPSVR